MCGYLLNDPFRLTRHLIPVRDRTRTRQRGHRSQNYNKTRRLPQEIPVARWLKRQLPTIRRQSREGCHMQYGYPGILHSTRTSLPSRNAIHRQKIALPQHFHRTVVMQYARVLVARRGASLPRVVLQPSSSRRTFPTGRTRPSAWRRRIGWERNENQIKQISVKSLVNVYINQNQIILLLLNQLRQFVNLPSCRIMT